MEALESLRAFPVLFVDDEAPVRQTFRYALEGRFTLLTAASGAEALDVLGREDVAVLLADQRMPNMTGSELCARARALKPGLVTMIVTAYMDIQAAIDAINKGQITAYIPKPWTEEQLVDALENAIMGVRASRGARQLGLDMLRAAPSHAAPAVRERLGQALLTQAALAREHAQDALALLEGEGPHRTWEQRRQRAVERLHGQLHVIDRIATIVAARGPAVDEPSETDPHPCDVAAVVEGLLVTMREELDRVHDVRVAIDATPNARIERADLGRILMDLLHTAANAAAQRSDAVITIRVSTEGAQAIVHVIDDATRPRANGRGDDTAALSLAHGLVERASGTLRLRDVAEGGRIAELRLPRA
jgi:CheY-like chemotaxis protein